jgi:hypothetical protein
LEKKTGVAVISKGFGLGPVETLRRSLECRRGAHRFFLKADLEFHLLDLGFD